MAAYPKAFEDWYAAWLKDGHYGEADTLIMGMREAREVKTLEQGEARLRRMLFFAWKMRVEEAKKYHPEGKD